jgi:hypothetical protein
MAVNGPLEHLVGSDAKGVDDRADAKILSFASF